VIHTLASHTHLDCTRDVDSEGEEKKDLILLLPNPWEYLDHDAFPDDDVGSAGVVGNP